MESIDIFNNSAIIMNRKTPKKITSWITILLLLIIIILIFSFIPFNIYKRNIGVVFIYNNEYFVDLKLENNDFPIYKNKKLYINNDLYKYEVIKIDNNSVILKINLNEEYKIDGNILNMVILDNRTTIMNIIKFKINRWWFKLVYCSIFQCSSKSN